MEKLKDLKKGDLFRFKDGKTVFIKGRKDRTYGYEYIRFDDISAFRYTKNGNKEVISKDLDF